jgi:hypothetical protein
LFCSDIALLLIVEGKWMKKEKETKSKDEQKLTVE